MTPLVVGIAVALAAAALVWLLASALRPARGRKRRRTAVRSPAGGQVAEAQAASVIRDAERALAEARREGQSLVAAARQEASAITAQAQDARETLLAEARESAGRSAAEIRNDAKRTARAIVQEAERKASEIVSEADLRRTEAERALARERELARGARRELTELLRDLLAEVRGVSGERPSNVYPLDEAHGPGQTAQAAQGSLRARERTGRKGEDGD